MAALERLLQLWHGAGGSKARAHADFLAPAPAMHAHACMLPACTSQGCRII
jgi:hypothetical protein